MQNKEKASVRLRSMACGKKPGSLLYSISASVTTTCSFSNRRLLFTHFQHYKKFEFSFCANQKPGISCIYSQSVWAAFPTCIFVLSLVIPLQYVKFLGKDKKSSLQESLGSLHALKFTQQTTKSKLLLLQINPMEVLPACSLFSNAVI